MEAQGDPRHGALQPTETARLRISDADRHQVSEVLRQAAGEGRLDLEELEERLDATFRARTYADLVPITADLPLRAGDHPVAPAAAAPSRAVAPAGPTYTTSVAVMSESKRLGPWLVPARHTAVAVMGSVTLDLREASFAEREVTIVADAVMGEVKILVDAATVVVVEGIGVMGEFQEQRAKVAPETHAGSPVVRVCGLALMGSVTVQRRGPGRGLRGRAALPAE
jgi:hypothetical protein